MVKLIFEEEFYKIKQACIAVRKELGNGFLEKVYQNYLKTTGFKLGILINFPPDEMGFEIERIPNFLVD